MLYRWHPKRRQMQFWDAVEGQWMISRVFIDVTRPPRQWFEGILMDYQDTWCEPEEEYSGEHAAA
jgi:hypothetical protein